MEKILITDDVHENLLQWFKDRGCKVFYQPDITLKEVHEIIHAYDGLIINSKILVDKALLDKATNLKFVARLGSGMEIIDQEYAKEVGIKVFSSPEGNCDAVGEHAVAMLLAVANNLLRADREVRQMQWNRELNRGFELKGKTIGIVGFGHTGSAFAKKIRGFECNVIAYDKYKSNYTEPYEWVTEATPAQIQNQADIISFHLPLTAETIHLVNEEYINECKAGVILINTSRGKVIQTQALVEALESGKVAAACLDVFENEKVETYNREEWILYHKLYQCKNVILSPHVAGWTKESKFKLSQILIDKISQHFNIQ